MWDFSTQAGWQKFLVFVIGIVGTGLAAFGMSQSKADSIVQGITVAIPLISTIAFYIVNQIAASGKAKVEIKKMEIAAANPGIVVPEVKPPSVSIPTVTTPIIEQEAPFNEQAFMDEVNKTVSARYSGNVNPSTIFYNAEQVYKDWNFSTDKQIREAKAILLKLADNAFKGIWGASYKDAWTYLNDPLGRGCPSCTAEQKNCTYPDLKYKARQLSTGHYTALLDYERISLIQ